MFTYMLDDDAIYVLVNSSSNLSPSNMKRGMMILLCRRTEQIIRDFLSFKRYSTLKFDRARVHAVLSISKRTNNLNEFRLFDFT